MRLLKKMDFPDMRFSLYFMGFVSEGSIPKDEVERTRWTFSQPATLELTHNWGTEIEAGPSTYHNGNTDPRGFGHIGLAVPDVNTACQRFEKEGVAFVKNPDGYWIEILSPNNMASAF